ncbi:hypothetical protein Cal6303_2746 [Calothrix sp. PCC 6303]|nr:hypothetical protein Cal6303_2746 [Calothrix sp. PCC 6303]
MKVSQILFLPFQIIRLTAAKSFWERSPSYKVWRRAALCGVPPRCSLRPRSRQRSGSTLRFHKTFQDKRRKKTI